MAWTGGGSAAVVSAGSATGSPGFSFVSTRTGTVFTLTDVGAWSGHQRALKLRASKGMTRTPSLTTGVGARGARRGLARAAQGQKPPAAAPRGQGSHAYWPLYDAGLTGEARTSRSLSDRQRLPPHRLWAGFEDNHLRGRPASQQNHRPYGHRGHHDRGDGSSICSSRVGGRRTEYPNGPIVISFSEP